MATRPYATVAPGLEDLVNLLYGRVPMTGATSGLGVGIPPAPTVAPTPIPIPGDNLYEQEMFRQIESSASAREKPLDVPPNAKPWQIILASLGDALKTYGRGLGAPVGPSRAVDTLQMLRQRREEIIAENQRRQEEAEAIRSQGKLGVLERGEERRTRAAERAEDLKARQQELESRQGFEARMQTQAEQARANEAEANRKLEEKLATLRSRNEEREIQLRRELAGMEDKTTKREVARETRKSVAALKEMISGSVRDAEIAKMDPLDVAALVQDKIEIADLDKDSADEVWKYFLVRFGDRLPRPTVEYPPEKSATEKKLGRIGEVTAPGLQRSRFPL